MKNMSMRGEKKWTSVRVLGDQYKRLSNDVKTPEGKELGYTTAADAVRQAISKVCSEIEDEMKNTSEKANAKVDAFLEWAYAVLEPKTHCCHCTPGPGFRARHPAKDGHPVHAQIPNCKCKPENYVLTNNDKEKQDHVS